MNPVKVIERLLVRECKVRQGFHPYEACIVCCSSVVWRISSLFQNSFIVSNAAAQVFPNIASIYYAVRELRVPLVAIVGTTSIDFESLLKLPSQAAEVEFNLLRKTYEENGDVLLSVYDNQRAFNAALLEINVDDQIEKLLSIEEFKDLVEKGELAVCGFVLDEDGIYGDVTNFYLINFNGIKDPEDIRTAEALRGIPESVRKQKVKRVVVQF